MIAKIAALHRSAGQFVRLDLPAVELAELQTLGYEIAVSYTHLKLPTNREV